MAKSYSKVIWKSIKMKYRIIRTDKQKILLLIAILRRIRLEATIRTKYTPIFITIIKVTSHVLIRKINIAATRTKTLLIIRIKINS